MKSIINFFTILAFILLGNSNFIFAEGEAVTGFILKMSDIKQLTDIGASSIKVFAVLDDKGTKKYLIVGLTSEGGVMSSKMILNTDQRDCPPTCYFLPSSIGVGTIIGSDVASSYIEKYLGVFKTENNAVIVCLSSIDKVAQKYNYMKITMTGKVKITGVKDDGSIALLAPFTKNCNSAVRSSL